MAVVAEARRRPARLGRARLGRRARRAAAGRDLRAGRVVAGARARRRATSPTARSDARRRRRAARGREGRRPRRSRAGQSGTARSRPGTGDRPRRGRRPRPTSRSSRPTRSSACRARTSGSSATATRRPSSSSTARASARSSSSSARPTPRGAAARRLARQPAGRLARRRHRARARDAARHDRSPGSTAASRTSLAGSVPPAAAEAAARELRVSDAPPVVARGLVKRYGEIVAVDHVDLTVERGDVFGYLGPNGAGKTTSLRMLLGLIRPTAGIGAAVRARPARRRRAGARRRRGLRRGAALLPVPLAAARNLRLLADYDGGDARVAHRRGARARRAARPRQGPRRRLLARHAPAARDRRVAPPRARSCCCSTSRRPASTRPGCATCATSSAASPARGSRSCSRATCSPRSRSSATASRSSATARSSTRARSTSCSRPRPSGYRLRAVEPERGAGRLLAQPGVEDVRLDGDELVFRADEDAVAALSIALGQARVGVHRARAADREPRGALPRHDRGRPGDARPTTRRRRDDRRRDASTAGSSRSCSRRSAPTSGSAPPMLVPIDLRRRARCPEGRPERRPARPLHPRHRLATPFVVLFFMSIWGLPLITALVAGDIVASESHNGTLKTILTRSRDRGEVFAGKVLAAVHYTAVARARDGRRRRASPAASPGASPAHLALRHDGLGRPRPRPARSRASASTPSPLAGDRRVRGAALDRHPQQRRVGRRHADVRAPDAAARRAARHRGDPARTCSARSSTPGTASCARPPTGRRSCARSGCARSTSRCRSSPRYLVFLRRDVAGE